MSTVYLSVLKPFVRTEDPPVRWWYRKPTTQALITPRPFAHKRLDEHATVRTVIDTVIARWCIERGYMSLSPAEADLVCTYNPGIHHAMTAVLEINPMAAASAEGYDHIRKILEADPQWFEDIQRLTVAIIHAVDDVTLLDHYVTRMYAAWQALSLEADIAWDVVHATIPYFWAVVALNAFLMRQIPTVL